MRCCMIVCELYHWLPPTALTLSLVSHPPHLHVHVQSHCCTLPLTFTSHHLLDPSRSLHHTVTSTPHTITSTPHIPHITPSPPPPPLCHNPPFTLIPKSHPHLHSSTPHIVFITNRTLAALLISHIAPSSPSLHNTVTSTSSHSLCHTLTCLSHLHITPSH